MEREEEHPSYLPTCLLEEEQVLRIDQVQEQDTEGDEDPSKLLDHWLGELDTLGKVGLTPIF